MHRGLCDPMTSANSDSSRCRREKSFRARWSRTRTARLFRSQGLPGALRHLLHVLRYGWKGILVTRADGYIVERELPGFGSSGEGRFRIDREGMAFHLVQPGEDLPSFCFGIDREETSRRLSSGHLGCVLKQGGEVTCSLWAGRGRVHYPAPSVHLYSDSTTFDLAPGQAWVFDVVCRPDLRGRGLATALLNETLRVLSGSGTRRVLATVGLDNAGSLKAFVRNGFQPVRKVSYRRLCFVGRRTIVPLPEGSGDGVIVRRGR